MEKEMMFKWYNFCGKINKDRYQNETKKFVDAFIDDVVYDSNKEIFSKNGEKKDFYLKIDCYNAKINFVKCLSLTLLFLLF